MYQEGMYREAAISYARLFGRAKALRDKGAPRRLRLDATEGRKLKARMLEARERAAS